MGNYVNSSKAQTNTRNGDLSKKNRRRLRLQNNNKCTKLMARKRELLNLKELKDGSDKSQDLEQQQ